MNNIVNKKGFGLLEIVVAIAIISMTLFALMNVSRIVFNVIDSTTSNIQAAFLLEEGAEALKILRDTGWVYYIENLSAGIDYYLFFSGGELEATTTPIYIDGIFERKFVISDVYRDALSFDIVDSGGFFDIGTKKIDLSVAWRAQKATSTKNLSFYITNLFNN